MVKTFKYKVGDKVGRLTILRDYSERTSSGRMQRFMDVVCDCGTPRKVLYANLIKPGHTTSCGCVQKEVRSAAMVTHGHTKGHRTQTYRAWEAMKYRVSNPSSKDYENYGGRGIKVCDRWLEKGAGFPNFLADMGECPETYSIDRIDVNGNYTPENCRWADIMTQAYNKQNTYRVSYKGEQVTIRDLSNLTGISYDTLYARIHDKGWSVEKAVETSLIKAVQYEYQGKMYTITELAELSGIQRGTIQRRLKTGQSLEVILTPPTRGKQYEYKGQSLTVTELSRLYGIHKNTLQQRLDRGISVSEAIEAPIKNKP